MTEEGLFFLTREEGLVLGRYQDLGGVWTAWIGHTKWAGDPDPQTVKRPDSKEEGIRTAIALLVKDVANYEKEVRRLVKVPVTSSQLDALVSFHFNTGKLGRSTLLKRLNRHDYIGAAREFTRWAPQARRGRERDLFSKGRYLEHSDAAVYLTTLDGTLVRPPFAFLSFHEFMEYLRGPRWSWLRKLTEKLRWVKNKLKRSLW